MSKHSARGTKWKTQRLRVLERDGWICSACGAWLESGHPDAGHKATVDHIEPIAFDPGREYEDHELIAMCLRCNGIKSDRILIRQPWWNERWLPEGIGA